MTPHKSYFTSYEPKCTPVRLADGKVVYSAGIGTVDFQTHKGGVNGPLVTISHVLHVPDLRCNLLSVLTLVRTSGFKVVMENTSISFLCSGTCLFVDFAIL